MDKLSVSAKEFEVIKLVMAGQSAAEISAALGIHLKTLRDYVNVCRTHFGLPLVRALTLDEKLDELRRTIARTGGLDLLEIRKNTGGWAPGNQIARERRLAETVRYDAGPAAAQMSTTMPADYFAPHNADPGDDAGRFLRPATIVPRGEV